MFLSLQNESLSYEILSSVTPANIDVFVSYNTVYSDSIVPESKLSNLTTISVETNLVPAPPANAQQQISFISFHNKTISTATVVVKVVRGALSYRIATLTIAQLESATYSPKTGFVISSPDGKRYVQASTTNSVSCIQYPPMMGTINATSLATMTNNGFPYMTYMGTASRAVKDGSVNVKFKCTSVVVGNTWSEIAIAKGPLNPSSAVQVANVVGWVDASTIFSSVGAKSVDIPLSAGQSFVEGEELWVVHACVATTAPVLRGLSIVDELGVGTTCSRAALSRPSTTVGVGVAYSLSATNLPLWCSLTY